MRFYEEETRKEVLVGVAKKMMAAARTAPKAKGVDNLVISYVEGETIKIIADKMKEMVEDGLSPDFYIGDANNIMDSEVLLLIATDIKPVGVKQCSLCGFSNCDEKDKNPGIPCSFNTGDLGIAIGSAVSIACDSRVDNRIMMSVGKAAKELNILGDKAKIIHGIPLSCTGKSPYFDRQIIK